MIIMTLFILCGCRLAAKWMLLFKRVLNAQAGCNVKKWSAGQFQAGVKVNAYGYGAFGYYVF